MTFFEIYKTKRDKAMEILAKLGAVKFVEDLELFHGRAGDGAAWEIKKQYNNAGNNSGNHNVFEVSGLYAANETVAKQFALARSRNGGVPEVHKIVSKKGTVLIDMRFTYTKLTPDQQDEYKSALRILNEFPIPRGVVIPFEKREIFSLVKEAIENAALKKNAEPLSDEYMKEIVNELAKEPIIRNTFANKQELYIFIQEFVGAKNAKNWLRANLGWVMNKYITSSRPKIKNQGYPLSNKYISAWCANNDVIGIITDISSATLDENVRDVVHFFDTTKIATESQHGEKYQQLLSKYSKLSEVLADVSTNEDINNFLQDANPLEIMQAILRDPICSTLYKMDSGVWENWTTGQHTQAVLQFFEDNYKGDILDNLVPFIKIVLLAHDAGKGFAYINNIPQEKANITMLPYVLDALKVKTNIRKLIEFIITQPYTSRIVLGKDKKQNVEFLCHDIVNIYCKIFKEKPTKNSVKGLAELAIILQTCDSGAYTRYAKICESSGAVIGGGNDRFTASFSNKDGKLRLKAFENVLNID